MVKEFHFRGYTLEQLKQMSIEEFSKLIKSRERRRLKRGMTEQQKKLLGNIRKHPDKFHKTHQREMVILPEMVGIKMGVHIGGAKKGDKGAKWATVVIAPEMVGKRLGDFAITIKKVKHSAPGIGATRGSKFISTK
jgi:small subunit ribosomal protein S19